MDHLEKMKFYFLNQDIGETLTGIESSSLLRARLFKKYLQISPIIITAAYNPRLSIQRNNLYDNGLRDQDCKIINMYEYFQGISDVDRILHDETYEMNGGWSNNPVESTRDHRIYDEKNQLIIYRKCDKAGNLMYNNIFINKKKIRRDVYDSRGFLSRTQHLNPETGQVAFESYHRLDGSICIYKYFKVNDSNNLEKIHLLNTRGEITNIFESETDLIVYWLKQLLNTDTHHFLIIDKERTYYPALQKIKQSNISIICMIHSSHLQKNGDILLDKINSNYRSIFEDLSIPDAVVFLTNQQKQHAEARFGPKGNFFAIPHPIEEKPKVDFENRVPLKAIYLARYAEEKQHDSLLRVFHKVVQKHPRATLDLYGYGDKRRAIIKQVKELGLEDNVTINEFVINTDKIYDTASLAVLPSRVEGLSLFLLESIAHGCPIVSYDVNYGPKDIVDEGITGYLVKPQDEEEMAERIIELFDSTEKLNEMSRAAYQKAESFQMACIAKKWSDLIEKVLT